MITSAPIPSWSSILLAYFNELSDDFLASPWQIQKNATWFSKSAHALATLIAPGDYLWLPEYFCNQSTIPARNKMVNIIFYPVKDNFTPDWEKCDLLYKPGNNKFILVHYFGIENDIYGALNFCSSKNISLIEDAAHVLLPSGNIGKFSDYTFYSPHKLLGIADGSILVSNHNTDIKTNYSLDTPWNWLIKRIIQKITPLWLWHHLKPMPPADFFLDSEGGLSISPNMLKFSRKMLATYLPNLDQEAAIRRDREKEWEGKLKSWPGIIPINGAIIPYRAVFRCDSETIACCYFNRLRELQIPVESWPDLPPEVKATPNSLAITLRKTLLFLPITAKIPAIPVLP